MITLQTGINNDLVVSNGNLVIISDTDQIKQRISETLQTFYGEWFLNNTIGVPWLQQILVSHPNLDNIQAILINAILAVPGVSKLNDFEFDFNNGTRALSVSFIAQTTNGQTVELTRTVGI